MIIANQLATTDVRVPAPIVTPGHYDAPAASTLGLDLILLQEFPYTGPPDPRIRFLSHPDNIWLCGCVVAGRTAEPEMTTNPKRTAELGDTAPPSALDQLLAVEGEIAAGEAAAAGDARALLDAARADIEARERQAATALERELAELDALARDRQAAAGGEIEEVAARLAARYRSLSAAEVARLAAFVADRVTGLIVEGAP